MMISNRRSLFFCLLASMSLLAPLAARAGEPIFLNDFESESVEYWSDAIGYPCPVFRVPTSEGGYVFENPGDNVVVYQALDGLSPFFESLLSVEIYEGFGGPMTPTNVNLEQDGNLGYDTCGTCILFLYHYDQSAGSYEKAFFPREGTLDITAITPADGETFAATLDATLREVTINPKTLETIPVPGGCVAPIHEYAFSQTVISPP